MQSMIQQVSADENKMKDIINEKFNDYQMQKQKQEMQSKIANIPPPQFMPSDMTQKQMQSAPANYQTSKSSSHIMPMGASIS
jgi:hypothetical protein